jgi:hypothetical protein
LSLSNHCLCGNIKKSINNKNYLQPSYMRAALLIFCSFFCPFLFLSWTFPAKADVHALHGANSSQWDIPGYLLLFPDLSVFSRFDQSPKRMMAKTELIPALNVFYTFDYQKFRFLGEWLLTTKSHNMERLQFGVHLGDEASLWLGRFHNPIGYWNMQYHHAAILQTSVSRPGIMAFETFGGVIPNHLTGLLVEGVHEVGNAGIYYTLAAGAGPDLLAGKLSPFNIFEPGGSHRPGASFRLGYQPVSYGADEIGVSAAYNELPGGNAHYGTIKQFIASLYGNWQFDSINLLSEAFYVNDWLDRPIEGNVSSDFVNAYVQVGWDMSPSWTLYGRLEGTLGNRNDPYLKLFPKYVEDRILGGIRYKVGQNMALKLEASQDSLRDDRFGQVMFQWSAVFP